MKEVFLLLVIIILLCVQLYMMIKIMQSLRHTDREIVKPTEEEKPSPSSTPTSAAPQETSENNEDTELNKVLKAIESRKHPVCEEDLPRVMEELKGYFIKYTQIDYSKDIESEDYYRFIDLRDNPSARVVVVGDIHSDYISLVAMLLKLSVSDYDYFKNAYFVFLGDYLDRGNALFETLLMLKDLKEILGNRLIMLKGNHESATWNEASGSLKPHVYPHETCDCVNNYCGSDRDFVQKFAEFYSTLPIYVYLKTSNQTYLLTHAAIPRDVFIDKVGFDGSSGALVFSDEVPESQRLLTRNGVFKDMIWGDPSKYDEKIQVEGRFEFGSKQFERWVSRNSIGMLLRSHEEAQSGYKPFFDDKLFTIFSTGGADNPQTGYPKVEPAFSIIHNDRFVIENSFIYNVMKGEGMHCINLLNKYSYSEKQSALYKLNNEFACNESEGHRVRECFKSLLAASSAE